MKRPTNQPDVLAAALRLGGPYLERLVAEVLRPRSTAEMTAYQLTKARVELAREQQALRDSEWRAMSFTEWGVRRQNGTLPKTGRG